MASQYNAHAYRTNPAASPPAGHRGISPAAAAAVQSSPPTASRSPMAGYNPAMYQGGPFAARRPSASPMRSMATSPDNERYNPQQYGAVAGAGGAWVPRAEEEAPPPPYSPPHSARQPPLHVSPPHARNNSYSQPASSTTPISPDTHPTPSTASTQQTFSSAYSVNPSLSSAGTTPLSPYESSGWTASPAAARRRYSPPSAQSYTPTSALQQTSFPPAPSSRSGSVPRAGIPPPPPGPPPRTDQSPIAPASRRAQSVSTVGSAQRDASVPPFQRSESLPRGIPPPPPGPPPRTGSIPRTSTPASGRSVSSPMITSAATQERRPSNTHERRPSGQERRPSISGPSSAAPNRDSIPPVPPIPPKRRFQEEPGNYREQSQRSSPKRVEEDAPTPMEQTRSPTVEQARSPILVQDNNPWRDAVATTNETGGRSSTETTSTLMEFDVPNAPKAPTPGSPKDTRIRRKPVSPTIVTHPVRPQLPTPPRQHTSPVSPSVYSTSMSLYSPMRAEHDEPVPPMPTNFKGKSPTASFGGIDDFFVSANRRYTAMLQAEATSSTEAEKLQVFLEFVAEESRLRLEHYDDISRGDRKRLTKLSTMLLPRSHSHRRRHNHHHHDREEHQQQENPQQITPISPVPDMTSAIDHMDTTEDRPRTRPETEWWGQGLTEQSMDPLLEARIRDEESSRGRTSSRWWETSVDSRSEVVRSDGLVDPDDPLRRPYRHSRATPRASLREIAEYTTSSHEQQRQSHQQTPNPNDPSTFMNSTAYPPDRKQYPSVSRSRSRPAHSRTRPPPKTSLDLAPLLTLLPSYPREHPAVNNSHPSLTVFRNLVRTLNDLDTLTHFKTRFTQISTKATDSSTLACMSRRNGHAEAIQLLYNSGGRLESTEIARRNAAFEKSENEIRNREREADFTLFEKEVVDPAHTDLQNRVAAATAAYTDLLSMLSRNPSGRNSRSTITGADGREEEEDPPELLEKLTCLKWIFDVREHLHTHIHQLLSERNARYKELLLAPLLDARDTERIRAAEEFFTSDAKTRSATFVQERRQRFRQFVDEVEHQVTRGVEELRSSFWEVAPLVLECLEKIPQDLRNVVPIVPPEEAHENPEWVRTPIRYLETTVERVEKAMRSFGEHQIELLCLLHGVKCAGLRVDGERPKSGIEGIVQEREEEVFNEDLKEKVRCIEAEWEESMGVLLDDVKDRVGERVEGEQSSPQLRR